ncbi:hypothetical protein TRP8649_00837 [Pelagimonas phthalicica]|uniref:Uncharacterized protein n=2 Tax=Pelagimonas phthalicica TaxID=1037362 RepID=A0A238J9Y0_9RHOB|nr:hypothetical protein CLV87_1234 [Pelagimonas phthalicica]SMX26752.1 hypothetical protein TRP8649_00837 [Pelagimonas phthalicica]
MIIGNFKELGLAPPTSILMPDLTEPLERVGYALPSHESYRAFANALNARYPDRKMIPFAQSLSNDDTAGFLIGKNIPPGTIIEIHNFASPGSEAPATYDSLSHWLAHKQKKGDLF